MAGEYALTAAEESVKQYEGDLNNEDEIIAHLDFLMEAGANFSYQDALQSALDYSDGKIIKS